MNILWVSDLVKLCEFSASLSPSTRGLRHQRGVQRKLQCLLRWWRRRVVDRAGKHGIDWDRLVEHIFTLNIIQLEMCSGPSVWNGLKCKTFTIAFSPVGQALNLKRERKRRRKLTSRNQPKAKVCHDTEDMFTFLCTSSIFSDISWTAWLCIISLWIIVDWSLSLWNGANRMAVNVDAALEKARAFASCQRSVKICGIVTAQYCWQEEFPEFFIVSSPSIIVDANTT